RIVTVTNVRSGEVTTESTVLFFFQAEDGIRDFHVTGVQTCALPIWLSRNRWALAVCAVTALEGVLLIGVFNLLPVVLQQTGSDRSEERRVGKECRARGSPYRTERQRETETSFWIT